MLRRPKGSNNNQLHHAGGYAYNSDLNGFLDIDPLPLSDMKLSEDCQLPGYTGSPVDYDSTIGYYDRCTGGSPQTPCLGGSNARFLSETSWLESRCDPCPICDDVGCACTDWTRLLREQHNDREVPGCHLSPRRQVLCFNHPCSVACFQGIDCCRNISEWPCIIGDGSTHIYGDRAVNESYDKLRGYPAGLKLHGGGSEQPQNFTEAQIKTALTRIVVQILNQGKGGNRDPYYSTTKPPAGSSRKLTSPDTIPEESGSQISTVKERFEETYRRPGACFYFPRCQRSIKECGGTRAGKCRFTIEIEVFLGRNV